MVYYFDMDGVLCNFHKEPYKYANAINRNWIASLDPFTENTALVKQLLCDGHQVYILSKAASDTARLGKLDWLARYIPELPLTNVIVIVGHGCKVDYMRTDTGILIDDDPKNVRPWIKAGHTAILLEYKGQPVRL